MNIVDLIDARCTGKHVEVWSWDRFEEFRHYILQDDKRIDLAEAKAGDGILASLLQRLRRQGDRKSQRNIKKSRVASILSGRIKKERVKGGCQ